MAELIAAYGGSVVPPATDIAREQVRIYGPARYEQLSRLPRPWRDAGAVQRGLAAPTPASGPGWSEHVRTWSPPTRSACRPPPRLRRSGPLMDRVFDPDAFTAWYLQQDGLQYRAFADFCGQSHTRTRTESTESGDTSHYSISLRQPQLGLQGIGGQMTHRSCPPPPQPAAQPDQRSSLGFDPMPAGSRPQQHRGGRTGSPA